MQIDQRGAKENCSGTYQNILIDNMVLTDAHDNRRNLACAWVDVKKAYDSLSHSWIEKMLEIHRFPSKLRACISNIMKAWNVVLVVPLEQGDVLSEPIPIANGVLQGDTVCPNLYTLSRNPISWELRRCNGYILSKPIKQKITHSFFIDDLKMDSDTIKNLEKMLSLSKEKMKDIGLEWNEKKSKYLIIKRGEVDVTQGDLKLQDGSKIKSLKNEEVYKFLGIPENEVHDITNIVDSLMDLIKKRASVIWSSPLSDHNKVVATNIFVHSCVEYFMWTEKINLTDLRKMDQIIRDILNKQNAKYNLQINESLYLPRSKGGRGLKQFEMTYKTLRIKSAIKIVTENEPRMKIVKAFDDVQRKTSRSSILKDTVQFAKYDFDAKLEVQGTEFTFEYKTLGNVEVTSDKSVVSTYLKKKSVDTMLKSMVESSWQGVIINQRYGDQDLVLNECFGWLCKWKDCPVEVINDMHSIYFQVIPTLTFLKYRGRPDITSTVCRLCQGKTESVKHLMSNCDKFAPTLYIRRHDRVLKFIMFNFLKKVDMIEKCPPWFSNVKINASYENSDILMLWDIPEYSGKDDEVEENVQRPDGKIIFKKKKLIYVIEMSVPWTENREDKLVEKIDKYANIIRCLKVQNPGFEVEQVTLIIDCLGGFSRSLNDNLKKLTFTVNECKHIVLGMQKIVVSEARSLINCFKMCI